jgi:hypothetical protein
MHALAFCALIPIWRGGELAPASRVLDGLPRELPSSGVGAWSLYQLLSFFPQRTLDIIATGRFPDPFSSASPFIPRDYLAGCAHPWATGAHRRLPRRARPLQGGSVRSRTSRFHISA